MQLHLVASFAIIEIDVYLFYSIVAIIFRCSRSLRLDGESLKLPLRMCALPIITLRQVVEPQDNPYDREITASAYLHEIIEVDGFNKRWLGPDQLTCINNCYCQAFDLDVTMFAGR